MCEISKKSVPRLARDRSILHFGISAQGLERIPPGPFCGLGGLAFGLGLHLLGAAAEEREVDIAARVLFQIGQQRGQVVAGPFERLVERRIVQQTSHGALTPVDAFQQGVHPGDRLGEFAGKAGLGQFRRDTVQIAHHAVDAGRILAQHHGEFREVLDGRLQVIATDHAPHTLEEKQRPYPNARC